MNSIWLGIGFLCLISICLVAFCFDLHYSLEKNKEVVMNDKKEETK